MGDHRFVVYKQEGCTYCMSAKGFLDALQRQRPDVEVRYIDVRANPKKAAAARRKSGMTTVPIVILDGKVIGGWDQLSSAAGSGRLDTYLTTGEWPPSPTRRWWPFGKKQRPAAR